MKRFFWLAVVLWFASLPAFAAKDSRNVNIPLNVTIGSQQLPAGEYKVTWTGPDSNLQVTVENYHGKTLATAPAKLVPAKDDNGGVAVDTRDVNGQHVLDAIDFSKFKLVLTNSQS